MPPFSRLLRLVMNGPVVLVLRWGVCGGWWTICAEVLDRVQLASEARRATQPRCGQVAMDRANAIMGAQLCRLATRGPNVTADDKRPGAIMGKA